MDLTLNFVGHLTDIERLKLNPNLEELVLMGNPCAKFAHYRQFAIATLPGLKSFDCVDIGRTERIEAQQELKEIRLQIMKQASIKRLFQSFSI